MVVPAPVHRRQKPPGKAAGGAAGSAGGVLHLGEGRRMTFFVTAVRPPAYRRSAEDYRVETLGPDRCRFTWTLALELTRLGKLNSPLTAPIIKRMFADTRRHFEQLAAAQ